MTTNRTGVILHNKYFLPRFDYQNNAILITTGIGHERIELPEKYQWDNRKMGDWPEHFFLQYTLSGSGMFVSDNRVNQIDQGKAFLCSRDHDFAYYHDVKKANHWEFLWIGFSGLSGQVIFKTIQRDFGKVIGLPRNSKSVSRIFKAMETSKNNRWKNVTHLSVFATEFLIGLIEDLRLGRRNYNGLVFEDIANYMNTHFAENLDIATLSPLFGYSREHLTRLFAKKYGKSPSLYLQEIRIAKATELLRMTSLPLAMVAKQSGFADVNYLCRVFRKQTGSTPLSFRNASFSRSPSVISEPKRPV